MGVPGRGACLLGPAAEMFSCPGSSRVLPQPAASRAETTSASALSRGCASSISISVRALKLFAWRAVTS